ncbi:hypothetical protein N7493_003851 [Penicillium malachiteum]|uniref:Uncharacterized protein n=1 Tax=Penicillium malachiteum TaxID=1324776 RepID=A0AAD6HQE7_9EURO|nr:hypothetical protein N7493_003851 [Penicillium malachiteum]
MHDLVEEIPECPPDLLKFFELDVQKLAQLCKKHRLFISWEKHDDPLADDSRTMTVFTSNPVDSKEEAEILQCFVAHVYTVMEDQYRTYRNFGITRMRKPLEHFEVFVHVRNGYWDQTRQEWHEYVQNTNTLRINEPCDYFTMLTDPFHRDKRVTMKT